MTDRKYVNISPVDRKLLDQLIESACNHVMTPEERRAQRISFIYGQLQDCAPDVTKEQIAKIVDEYP